MFGMGLAHNFSNGKEFKVIRRLLMQQLSEHAEQIKSFLRIVSIVALYGIGSVLGWSVAGSLGLGFNGQILLVVLVLLTFPVAVLINNYLKGEENSPSTSNTIATTKDYPELTDRAEEVVQWLKNTKLGLKPDEKVVY
ncbi:MAG: hypothetical protein FD167_3232, partial [bacterium]